MSLVQRLWRDQSGAIVTAEAVLVGTVGVLGAVVGLSTISHAIEAELKDTAFAIRSLDQGYAYAGHSGCCALTAGSYFIQTPVEKAIADLGAQSEADAKAIQTRIDAYRQQTEAQPDKKEKKDHGKHTQPEKNKKREHPRKKEKQGAVLDESSSLQSEPNDLPADATL